jgi:hypothetical protein
MLTNSGRHATSKVLKQAETSYLISVLYVSIVCSDRTPAKTRSSATARWERVPAAHPPRSIHRLVDEALNGCPGSSVRCMRPLPLLSAVPLAARTTLPSTTVGLLAGRRLTENVWLDYVTDRRATDR